MRHHRCLVTALGAMLLVVHSAYLVAPPMALAHPLGNFSTCTGHLSRPGVSMPHAICTIVIAISQDGSAGRRS